MNVLKKRTQQLIAAVGVSLVASSALAGGAMAAPGDGPGNIDKDHAASLTIHKLVGAEDKTSSPTGEVIADAKGTPLAGVTFELSKVSLDVHKSTDWPIISGLKVAEDGTVTDMNGAVIPATFVSNKVTDAQGTAVWNPLEQGVYVVRETVVPDGVVERIKPFLVTVPMPKASDSSWIYDVNVYPKNMMTAVEKSVTDPGAAGLGTDIPWQISMNIPELNTDALTHVAIRDTLHLDFLYKANSAKGYSVVNGVETEVAITEAFDDASNTYTWSVNDPAALPANSKFVVKYTTKLGSLRSQSMDGQPQNGIYTNSATAYINDPSYTQGIKSNTVKTQWGAVDILKHVEGQATNFLADAKFRVFASEADAKACIDAINAQGGTECQKSISVTTEDKGQEHTTDLWTTDANGQVKIEGLNVGTEVDTRDYYLVEVKAPAGYVRLDAPVKVTVTPTSSGTAIKVDVPNAQESPFTLPFTGAQSSAILAVAAVLLTGGAVFLLGSRRSSKTAD